MTKQQNTPELRFPEFEEEWNQIYLKEICDITSSKRVYAKDYVKQGIPFFRGKEISSNGFKHQEDLLYISEEVYNYFSEKYGSPKEGDLLITSVGTIGNVALIPSDFKFYFKDGNLIWLKDIKKNPHFLKYYLESFQGKKRLLDKASGSNQKALTISGLESLKVNTTNNIEEIKIKTFFNKLDRQIELEEEKLELIEQQKKGYMQKIFSQELRFKDKNNKYYPEWYLEKLNELGDTFTGLSGKTKDDFGYGDGVFITYMNVFKNTIAKSDMIGNVNIEPTENQNRVQYGDILFTTSSEVPNEVGMSSIWLFNQDNVYLNSFCFGFRVAVNYINPVYLARYLRSEEMRKIITILAQGSTRFNISKKEMMKLNIKVPHMDEQNKIVNFFNKIDKQILKQGKKIDLLKQRKQGLLQKMFV